MLRETPVGELMVTDVLTFAPGDSVEDAMRSLIRRDVDGAPVLDGGKVVGLLTTADLIVEEAQVHLPTVVTLLGAYLELPSSKKKFDEELEKALGGTVGEVMTHEFWTVGPDDTVETAATVMHENGADRLPVIDAAGSLVGIIARGDIVRAIVRELDEQSPGGANG